MALATTHNQPDHQGRYLPPRSAPTKLPKISILEERNPDLHEWLAVAAFTLNPLDLKRLVSTKIPRPPRDHPAYDRWRYWSTMTAGWLYSHVSKTIQKKLCTKPYSPYTFLTEQSGIQYADEVMEAIIGLMKPENRNGYVMMEVQKLWDITGTRTRFRSAKEFIKVYETQTTLLRSRNAAPAPLYTLTAKLEVTIYISRLSRGFYSICDPNSHDHSASNDGCGPSLPPSKARVALP